MGTSVTIDFPISFQTQCFGVWALARGSHGSIYAYAINTLKNASVVIVANGGATQMSKSWFALGI